MLALMRCMGLRLGPWYAAWAIAYAAIFAAAAALAAALCVLTFLPASSFTLLLAVLSCFAFSEVGTRYSELVCSCLVTCTASTARL